MAWIAGVLSTSSKRILIDGIPGAPIRICKGLRQGDPLSPMLFILMMEPLQRFFSLADNRGLLTPLTRAGLNQRMSIFADDVMLFLKPVEGEMQLCMTILDIFPAASGLQANMAKTSAMPIRCSELQVADRRHVGLCNWDIPVQTP